MLKIKTVSDVWQTASLYSFKKWENSPLFEMRALFWNKAWGDIKTFHNIKSTRTFPRLGYVIENRHSCTRQRREPQHLTTQGKFKFPFLWWGGKMFSTLEEYFLLYIFFSLSLSLPRALTHHLPPPSRLLLVSNIIQILCECFTS